MEDNDQPQPIAATGVPILQPKINITG